MKLKSILIIAGIVLVSLLVVAGAGYLIYSHVTEDKPLLGISGYYNENGDPIGSSEQAVVGDVEGVRYLTFKINALNEDYVPLTFQIIDAEPYELFEALPSTEITVDGGEYASWNSGLVDIIDYEGSIQPFTVTVIADSPARQPDEKTATIEIEIKEDPVSSFDVEIVSETNNDPNFEPEPDIPDNSVIFRMSSSTDGIAFAETCGETLVAYGRETNGADQDDSCETRFSNPAIFENLPVYSLNSAGDGNVKLFRDESDEDEVWLCENRAGSTKSCYIQRFDKGDSDASDVLTDPFTLDPSREVAC